MKRLLQLSLALFIVTGLTTIANAQSSKNATIKASAVIQSSVTISGPNDLNFGAVPSGTPTPVSYNDANAGRFDVSGNETVTLGLSLPSNLTNSNSTTMPINFSTSDAAWSDDGTNYNEFDPTNGNTINLDLWDNNVSSDGAISVYIGGEVNPAANQEAGTYNGDITLTAEYN